MCQEAFERGQREMLEALRPVIAGLRELEDADVQSGYAEMLVFCGVMMLAQSLGLPLDREWLHGVTDRLGAELVRELSLAVGEVN